MIQRSTVKYGVEGFQCNFTCIYEMPVSGSTQAVRF